MWNLKTEKMTRLECPLPRISSILHLSIATIVTVFVCALSWITPESVVESNSLAIPCEYFTF